MDSELIFIDGEGIFLRPILKSDITDKYLGWLNDPNINQYSNRQAWPTTEEGLEKYIQITNTSNNLLLAIVEKQTGIHVGNILLGPINWIHRNAKMSILLGKESAQRRGYAREAWQLLTKHAFEKLNLHRLEASTFHPAVESILKGESWTLEGTFRQGFYRNGAYHDLKIFGIITDEFFSK